MPTSAPVFETLDGNEAVARVAYALNEVIAIYPITPATAMGEWADAWSSSGQRNLWGTVPSVVEMQSEGGAAGVIHGALQTGALATTFTASQGLLLMIPNMYKIAGELTPTVFHIAARSLAAQALSIFGDHSDVMAARSTGWAMLCSSSVQEAQDFALISQAASFESRIPFVHFFDGFRTSHEIAKIVMLSPEEIRSMISEKHIAAHRERALSPDHPVIRGTAQNPDVYFQGRETVNRFYLTCPNIVQNLFNRFAELTGRQYQLYQYYGDPKATRVIVLMGSGSQTVEETVDELRRRDERVGVLNVRLYRPFDVEAFAAALPATTESIAVLDRCKEPGSSGEPLYLDVVSALHQVGRASLRVVGGRYGLSSKEFTPPMVMAVFHNLSEARPKHPFTIGIHDDLTHTSLEFDPNLSLETPSTFRGLFFGLGSDGTVSANKDSIKIIGEQTSHFAQGYFVYDSKKSGAITVSHLRFGPAPIRAQYLISQANFIGCHQPLFLERMDVAEHLAPGGTLLLNTSAAPEKVWETLPTETQERLIQNQGHLYIIDAAKVARESGMGGRINTIMQVCFFSVSGVLPHDEALTAIRDSIRKTYRKKGDEVVQRNLAAVEATLNHLHSVEVPSQVSGSRSLAAPVSAKATPFVRDVLGSILSGHGDRIPVSAMPPDGTFPSGTSRWEKRNLATEIPVWDSDLCIQCGKCVLVCPHAAIRSKVYPPEAVAKAPDQFQSRAARLPEWKGMNYTLQVAPEDCTGCAICVDVCPVRSKTEPTRKALVMNPQAPLRESGRREWDFFLGLPQLERHEVGASSVREMQTLEPLFEFSGACSGCGETPYLKLLTQLFGDRLLVANATGCSSIFGGNLPTTPWTHNQQGLGPAWSNSLFEDNAEFGLGFRVSIDKQHQIALELLQECAPQAGAELTERILHNPQLDEAEVHDQRSWVAELKQRIAPLATSNVAVARLLGVADILVRKSVWIVGGDGWAYDIGYGGLDHVLASGRNVKVLVLDTEVYSNTGGQCSKSTPRGAVAKFAAGGKPGSKKDLGLMAMTYGHVYVASIAMGAKDEQTLKAFLEAESYPGPALIIAYSHCIAHGMNMTPGMQNHKAAVQSGQWILYRFDPRRRDKGESPLQIDSAPPRTGVDAYQQLENRFRMLAQQHPDEAKHFADQAQHDATDRWDLYQYLAARPVKKPAPVGNP